jgi:hypothetical protein
MSEPSTKENFMKRLAIALLAAAGLAASSARADHDSRVTVRGSIHVGAPIYSAPSPVCETPAPVYYAPAPHHHAPARGYWKEVVVKTWIPERWSVRHDRWGRPIRVCEPGHYAYRTDRIWVDGRHDRRGHSYGYGRR